MIRVSHTSGPKTSEPLTSLDEWICLYRLLFVIFIGVVGFSRRDFSNSIGVVIRVSVCFQSLFFSSSFSSQIIRRREERKKIIKTH
jgi:hypothetical protein